MSLRSIEDGAFLGSRSARERGRPADIAMLASESIRFTPDPLALTNIALNLVGSCRLDANERPTTSPGSSEF